MQDYLPLLPKPPINKTSNKQILQNNLNLFSINSRSYSKESVKLSPVILRNYLNKSTEQLLPTYNKFEDLKRNKICLEKLKKKALFQSADSEECYDSAISHNSSFSSNFEVSSSNLYYSACEILFVKDYEEILSDSINWSLNKNETDSIKSVFLSSNFSSKSLKNDSFEEDEKTELIENGLASNTITKLSNSSDENNNDISYEVSFLKKNFFIGLINNI